MVHVHQLQCLSLLKKSFYLLIFPSYAWATLLIFCMSHIFVVFDNWIF